MASAATAGTATTTYRVGSIGPSRPRGWLSTGDADGVRTEASVRQAAASLEAAGLADLEVHVFHGGHMLLDEDRKSVV